MVDTNINILFYDVKHSLLSFAIFHEALDYSFRKKSTIVVSTTELFLNHLSHDPQTGSKTFIF